MSYRDLSKEQREACVRYAADLFAPEDEVLRDLRMAIEAGDLPQIHISSDEGRLLQVLLRAVQARRVVELGTLGGYSAIWMARALP
jgi:predicted O-methyltransferase YrrM